eukprot:2937207-Prymnesium_polylepis.1
MRRSCGARSEDSPISRGRATIRGSSAPTVPSALSQSTGCESNWSAPGDAGCSASYEATSLSGDLDDDMKAMVREGAQEAFDRLAARLQKA